MLTFYPTFLLGAVFLLFPLAHLRLFPAIPLYLSEIPLLIATGLWLSTPQVKTRLRGLLLRERSLVLASSLFLGGALMALFMSQEPLLSLGLLKSFIILPLLFMGLLSLGVRTEAETRHLLTFWWWGVLASAFAALLLSFLGVVTYDGRQSSLYASPNHLAMLLAPGVLIGIYLSATCLGRGRTGYRVGTLLILFALFETHSYASLGALFLSILMLFFPFRKDPWAYGKPAFLLGALLLGLWFFLETPTAKFQSLLDLEGRSSSASRLMIWEAAGKISLDHFPWGIGLGRFQQHYLEYQKYFPPYLEWAVPEPHNLLLALFLSTGFLGLLGFIWVFFEVGGRLYRTICSPTERGDQLQGKLYLSLLIWFLVVGLVDTPYFKNDLALAWWGLIGLSVAWLTSRAASTTTS